MSRGDAVPRAGNTASRAPPAPAIQRERMCFAFETRESLRVAGYFLGQELQCNEAMKPGVLGLVDDAHATAAEFLYDAIVRNGLAD